MAHRRRPSEKFGPIPDDYAEMIGDQAEDPAFQAAWTHAESKNNPPKACMIYAENHAHEYAPKETKAPTAEEIEAEIERLTRLKQNLEESAS